MDLNIKDVILKRILKSPLTLILFVFVTACGVSKQPVGKPYVWDNKIRITTEGNDLKPAERKDIETRLYDYIDDSLRVRIKTTFGIKQRVEPPVFDSNNIDRSFILMKSYLNSLGYYRARLDTFTVDTLKVREGKYKGDIRVVTNFLVSLGKVMRFDSIRYNFKDSNLARLVAENKGKTLLYKGEPYSKQIVTQELDRLVAIFRAEGYFKLNRNSLAAWADTTDLSLIDPNLSLEQQLIIAQQRAQNPTVRIRIEEHPKGDSAAYLQYRTRKVTYYPETMLEDDVDELLTDSSWQVAKGRVSRTEVRYKKELFIPKIIFRNNYMRPDSIYREADYFRSINAFTQLGPWQQVDVRSITTISDTANFVDFNVFLYPAKKQNFQADVEASQNTNTSSSQYISGSFLGFGVNLSHRNRNNWRRAVQSATSLRFGAEISRVDRTDNTKRKDFAWQTLQASLSHSYAFPRLVWPFEFLNKYRFEGTKTIFSTTGQYVSRIRFYKQASFGASSQWQAVLKGHTLSLTIPNFESTNFFDDSAFQKELDKNPALKTSFTPGNVLSMRLGHEYVFRYKNKPKLSTIVRSNVELALPPGRLQIFGQEFFSFGRIQTSVIHKVLRPNGNSWNYRFFGGVGVARDNGSWRVTMPYFRQFVAGGANSMRAWRLRQLGLGNSLFSDTAANFKDRFGDIQLELNAEYRFKLFKILGYQLSGAAFVDAGNVWNRFSNSSDGEGALVLKNLYRDIALGVGTGIRYDFSYIVIRVDAGFKVKDPVRTGDGWLRTLEWRSANRVSRETSNISVQFGIGYPF